MATIPDCTLTTACYCLTKYSPLARNSEKLITGFDTLLKTPCCLVINCNEEIKDLIIQKRKEYNLLPMTKIIIREVEDLWIYRFAEQIKKNREAYWPTKSERDFLEKSLIQFNKFSFVKETIEFNPFKTSQFGWIDSDCNLGDGKNKLCEGNFTNLLLHCLKNAPPKFHLNILNVQDKKFKLDEHKKEYFSYYHWLVVGGFFTTPAEIGLKIIKRLNEIIEHTIQLGYGDGEEHFYLEILDEFYDDIYRSYGDYQQVLNNYLKPVKNMVYIYWQIVMKYYEFKYYRECIDTCYTIISSYDNFLPDFNYDMYVRIYSVLYLSLLNYDTDQAEIIAKQIRHYYSFNPLFNYYFDHLKGLIGMTEFRL